MTEVHSKIDAIIGELEKASKTHVNQAKKLGVILATLKKAKGSNG